MDSIQSFENVRASGRFFPQGLTVQREVVIYLIVGLLALVLRVAQLDVVPLTTQESRQALAAWRVVYPEAAGTAIVPESPIGFALHYLSFSVLGPSEFSARILTVIASVLLVLSPSLFSSLFGKTRTLIMVLLLAFSPTMLATGRMDSPVVWTYLAVVAGLWGIWQFHLHGRTRFALLATICAGAVVFLTEPTGVFVLATLALAGLFLIWMRRNVFDVDTPSQETVSAGRLSNWPWGKTVPIAILVVFLASTLFMFYPAGVSSVGELLGASLRGLTTSQPYLPPFFAVLTTIFYEPLLVILGLVAAFVVITRDDIGWEDRFLLGWFIFSLGLAFLYAGTRPEHALWLVIPLVGLASRLVVNLVVGGERFFAPPWSRWLIALVVGALAAMISVHAQAIGRSLLTTPAVEIQQVNINPQNLIGIVIAILLVLIGYFLASSEWGEGTAVRGGILGVLAFAMITGIGAGWQIAVNNSESAIEFWNRNPTSNRTIQLRQTLLELADRETSGFPELAITAFAPDDGVVAWLLRDFPNTTFVTDATAARGQGVVLLPSTFTDPDLGSAYVGQTVAITNGWDFRNVTLLNFPAWWLQRRTLTGHLPNDAVTLWLRQDIYNGVSALDVQ
ncbi:MAG: glycosyltransferase family 39 protein [Chloroflexi bacterium]|nr:glycosyltransferase family 39 protein [Chloroflexota bacterium]MCC6896480.1 glycosyltransferase family 39 protein [Anaerolineae bacterium]